MKPIIRSLLDLDFYKLTMAQAAWLLHRDAPVRYAFTNRTRSVRIADIVPEAALREEIARVRGLRFGEDDLAYLRESRFIRKGLFAEAFLDHLRGLTLPEVEIEAVDGQYRIETEGPWPSSIFWETMVLSAVNELYYRGLMERDGVAGDKERENALWRGGTDRLKEKMEVLRTRPGAKIIEFGTRRRFSASWQEAIVNLLIDEAPQHLAGTSNVQLAKSCDLPPIGTMAHEMFMVYAGIYGDSDEGILASHNKVLDDWWALYGAPLSIALTDTYTTDAFFRMFPAEAAAAWRGLRQDSGDAEAFGEKAIAFYESRGIDPKGKLVVFSDGLDAAAIVRLHARFDGRIGTSFGWGTNLTNDLGYGPLSLVMKAVGSCGRPVVKLSDNPAKATGPAAEVERYLRVFGATPGESVECTY